MKIIQIYIFDRHNPRCNSVCVHRLIIKKFQNNTTHPLWTTWKSTLDRLINFILDCTQNMSTQTDKTHTQVPPIPAALAGCIVIKEKGWKKQALWYSRDWHRDREGLWIETRLDRMAKRKQISKLFYNHFTRSLLLSFSIMFVRSQDSLSVFPLSLSVIQLMSHLLSAIY